MTEYWNTWYKPSNEFVKRSIQKKWNLDKFLEGASQREDINQQIKDIKEDFNISKVEHQWEDFPKNGKWGGRGSSKKPPRPPRRQEHKKEEKRKAKAVATVERQWSTPSRPKLPSIQTAVLKVWQIQSFCVIMCTIVLNLKRDLRSPREGEQRKQHRLRRQAVTRMMSTFTFRRQHNTYTEWRR